MADRIIWGAINADGTVRAGSGFDCTHMAPGTYFVDFDTPFSSMPVVVLTQNYTDWGNFSYPGGDTRDNAVLIASDQNKFKAETGDSTGARGDRNFTFIAIGPG